jgi:hypothetical protein
VLVCDFFTVEPFTLRRCSVPSLIELGSRQDRFCGLIRDDRVCEALRKMGRADVAATLDEWISEHGIEDEDSQRGLGRLVRQRHGASGMAALEEAAPAATARPFWAR